MRVFKVKKVVRSSKYITKSKINKKLNKYKESLGKKSAKDLTADDLEQFVKMNFLTNSTNDNSKIINNISILNKLLSEKGVRFIVNSDNLIDYCTKSKKCKYLTKDELKQICDNLVNYQDKFIVYAFFKGIVGSSCKDLLSIRTKDVAKDLSYIIIKDKIVFTDDILKEYLKGLLDEKIYIKDILKIGKFKEEYELDSPYLIKVLPSKKSNYRARKMTTTVLRDRLENIRFLLFLNLGKNVVLTPVSLFYSGIMSDMHEKQLADNKEWDILSLGEYLELRGYHVNCFELYNEYCNKYIPKKIVTEYNWS